MQVNFNQEKPFIPTHVEFGLLSLFPRKRQFLAIFSGSLPVSKGFEGEKLKSRSLKTDITMQQSCCIFKHL